MVLRSLFVKGLEAITAECALAAVATGVFDRVIGSLERIGRHAYPPGESSAEMGAPCPAIDAHSSAHPAPRHTALD